MVRDMIVCYSLLLRWAHHGLSIQAHHASCTTSNFLCSHCFHSFK